MQKCPPVIAKGATTRIDGTKFARERAKFVAAEINAAGTAVQ